jgi:hemolysin III
MRGTLHAAMAVAAPFLLVALILSADSPRAYVGASIFAASLCALYTTSATYHLGPWRGWVRGLMLRMDHSMIFALIAGTYTPFCLLVLDNAWGITMLSVVWALAGGGVLLKVLWPTAPRWLGVALYLSLGWVGIVAAGQLTARLSGLEIALLMAGGAFYSVGSVVYALRRPNPAPRFFGYHEVFHSFVIAGSLIHFALLAVYILPS